VYGFPAGPVARYRNDTTGERLPLPVVGYESIEYKRPYTLRSYGVPCRNRRLFENEAIFFYGFYPSYNIYPLAVERYNITYNNNNYLLL